MKLLHQHAVHQHAAPTSFIRKYVFSLDHKVIGKQYYGLALVAVFIGMVLSWLMRIHLGWPAWPIPLLDKLSAVGAPGGVMTPEYYLSLMTMHGTIMIFFVLTNAPFAAFGNYFLPIQIGAEDMAFPRFNMMSFWTTFPAFLVMMAAFFVADGPPIAGWTSYAPLSAVGGDAGPGLARWARRLWAISIALFCISSLLGALNFIATTLDLRTKGMSLARMPLSTWAWFVTAVIALLAFAVLAPCLHSSYSRSHRGNQLLHPSRIGRERQVAAARRRLSACYGSICSGFLATRRFTSRFCHPSASSARSCRHSHVSRSSAACCCWLLDRHRIPELHGVGTSHVRERHESVLRESVFGADPDYHHSDDHHGSVDDWHGVWREDALHGGLSVLPGVYFRVHQWRHQRLLSSPTFH